MTGADRTPFVSFSCPHFRFEDDWCLRLKADCVPGRKGCVLAGNTVFAVPAEVRVREREEERRRMGAARPGPGGQSGRPS